MTNQELKEFLDEKVDVYNRPDFITSDPIQIPHRFSIKQDAEIAGFLTATIAWGNRKSIIQNAEKLVRLLGNSPYDFVMEYKPSHKKQLQNFVHRTFNAVDLNQFIIALQQIYTQYKTMEDGFLHHYNNESDYLSAIERFRASFICHFNEARTNKHFSNPGAGSAAKRINMFLRWMVRNDKRGVDMGWWEMASPALLSCPLDVHSGNVARGLGILKRHQNDRKAVEELNTMLRSFDEKDPAKYDFALFGIGVFEENWKTAT